MTFDSQFNTNNMTLVKSKSTKELDKLLELYKKDKIASRVFFYSKRSDIFCNYHLFVFEGKNKNFKISVRETRYGINKNSIIYNNSKNILSITFKDNKFHYVFHNGRSKSVRQLNLRHLYDLKYDFNGVFNDIILDFIKNRVDWLEGVFNNGILNLETTLNKINKDKLFTKKKQLNHKYKGLFSYEMIKQLEEINSWSLDSIFYYKEYIKNFNKLNISDLRSGDNNQLLVDTLSMAKSLNLKVNLGWSPKRLKLEHDKMSKTITEYLYCNDNQPINNAQWGIDFDNYTNEDLTLIKDTKSLAYEGMRMCHCVATYLNKINTGLCCIFNYKNLYTLELQLDNSSDNLTITQFKGFQDKEVPINIYSEVSIILGNFNQDNQVTYAEIKEDVNLYEYDDLPF